MLPHPVTFVCNLPEGCPNLYQLAEGELPSADSLHFYLGRGNNAEINWVLRTYLILKHKGLNVSLSPELVSGQICVIAPYQFQIFDYGVDCFVVGCRADFAEPVMCDFLIVQNKANVKSEREFFIPHWPQPGLLPRLPERGARIENMAFKGRSWNLYHEFRSPEFVADLAKLGVQFEDHHEVDDPTATWSDYRTCDLLLAVRDLTEYDALLKPASKLVNAWIAGVPAILGPEPAFRDLRQSELDYFEVTSRGEVLDAIRRLRAEPSYYEAMVANGLRRAEEFSEARIASMWIDALSGPVAQHFDRWRQSSRLARIARFPVRAIRQKLAYKEAIYNAHHGHRIVSGLST